jgi:phosphate transport system substrate-binding protein
MADPPANDFIAEAERAGLVLPPKRRANPWLATALVVVIVLSALGIGAASGWLNPSSSSSGFVPPTTCSSPAAQLYGSLPDDTDPGLNASVQNLSAGYREASGNCVETVWNSSPSADPLGELASREVDVASVDLLPTPAALAALPSPALVYPSSMSAVLVAYNLPGAGESLHLNGAAIAEIYLGQVRDWNDPRLTALDPALASVTPLNITVVYRSDASSLTSQFTGYLAESDANWADSLGTGEQVSWRTGHPVEGNGAMVGYLATHPGAIGYLTGTTPVPVGVGVAELQNAVGKFASANATGLADAAMAMANASDASGSGGWDAEIALYAANWSYPLTTFSYFVLYADLAKAYGSPFTWTLAWGLLAFLEWAAHEGAPASPSGVNAELPASLVTRVGEVLDEVDYNGASVVLGGDAEGGEPGNETGEF